MYQEILYFTKNSFLLKKSTVIVDKNIPTKNSQF